MGAKSKKEIPGFASRISSKNKNASTDKVICARFIKIGVLCSCCSAFRQVTNNSTGINVGCVFLSAANIWTAPNNIAVEIKEVIEMTQLLEFKGIRLFLWTHHYDHMVND